MKLLRIAALAALTVAIAGCPATSTMTTARSIDKGKFQGWVAPGATGINVADDVSNVDISGTMPQVEFGFRYGISDGMDVGTKLGVSGLSVDYKWNFLRAETSDSGLDLAIDPSIGYGLGINASLPLLVGINFSGHQLVLGPKVMFQNFGAGFVGGVDTSVNVIYAGGSLGLSLKLGESFRMMPEFSIAFPMTSTWEASAGNVSTSNDDPYKGITFYQAGLAFMFGG